MQRLATSVRVTSMHSRAPHSANTAQRECRCVAHMLQFSSAAVAVLDVSGMLPAQPLRDAVSLGLSDDAWLRGVPLQIVVLGTSPTSGCNACHLTLPNETRDARCIRGAKHCDPHVGWGGQLRERLAAWLPSGVPVEVAVHGKSAVSAGYHSKCTSARVPAGPGVIVLVEVATNLWGGPTVAKGLVAAIRRASPRAAIAFVAWVPMSGFKLAAAGQPRPAELYEAGPVARLADMLRVSVPLHRALKQPPLLGLSQGVYSDSVHPNALGHALLAEVVVRFIASRVAPQCVDRDGTPTAAAGCGGSDAGSDGGGEPPAATGGRSSASAAAEAEVATPPPPSQGQVGAGGYWESCYTSADLLPVDAAKTAGWQLLDDAAGSAKGASVRKLGLVSHRAGDKLTLGPLAGPPGAACATLEAELGYLSRPSREGGPAQGAIVIECEGCSCRHTTHPSWMKVQPFPTVQTDAYRAADNMLRNNISVTATTTFLMSWSRDVPCRVRVTHAPGGGGSAGSRVLVSSLTLSQAELGEQLLATAHACGFPKKYGKVCTTGKNEMLCERKHYVAACAAQPPNRARGGTEANAVRLCAWISNVSASA
jgi:hypothetical protein